MILSQETQGESLPQEAGGAMEKLSEQSSPEAEDGFLTTDYLTLGTVSSVRIIQK